MEVEAEVDDGDTDESQSGGGALAGGPKSAQDLESVKYRSHRTAL